MGVACLNDDAYALAATPATRRALAENLAAISHAMARGSGDPTERDALDDCALRLPDTLLDERREFDLGGHVVRVRSEEHTSELQSLMRTSYAVFCLTKQTPTTHQYTLLPSIHTLY